MENNGTLYDLAFLKKFTNNDPQKVERYIQTYLRTSERIFAELEEAGAHGSWEDAYTKAHTVKPQVQYMGIASLLELIMEIENKAKADPGSTSLSELVGRAAQVYKKSSIELMTYLQETSQVDR